MLSGQNGYAVAVVLHKSSKNTCHNGLCTKYVPKSLAIGTGALLSLAVPIKPSNLKTFVNVF
jgi:hypothetical protein